MDTELNSFTKINSKWNIDLSGKLQNSEKITREDLPESGYGNDFLNKTQRYDHENRNRLAKFVKIKRFLSVMVLPEE